MQQSTVTQITIDNLKIAKDNPRFEPKKTEDNALEIMINSLGNKFVNLAQDIFEKGLNPSKLPIVIPDEGDAGKYIVSEGNRRVAALKILANHSRLDELKISDKYRDKLKELCQNAKGEVLNEINCAVSNQEDANYWIALEHTGENAGVGVVGWDGIAAQRFRGSSPALQAIDLVKNSSYIDANTKSKLSKIPITNVERVLSTPEARIILGVDVKNKTLFLKAPEDKALLYLSVLVSDIANKTKKVTQLDTKEQRIEYANSIVSKSLPKSTSSKLPKKPVTSKAGASADITRKTLISSKLTLNIPQDRLAKIFSELQVMNLEKCINACAVMFRVFIEMSVDDYAQREKISLTLPISHPKAGVRVQTNEMHMRKKLETIVKYFKDNNICSDDELFGVTTIINNKNHVLSVDSLNAYVHNKDYYPTASDLKSSWNNMQIFVQRLWE
jgi:hypothetical protein